MTTTLIARGDYTSYSVSQGNNKPDVAFGIFCVIAFFVALIFRKHNS